MLICDVMTDRVISINQKEPVTTAARLLKQHNIGALPVCDDQGRLRGMITDRDIAVRCVAAGSDPQSTQVCDVMTRGIVTAAPFEELDKAVYLMSTDQVRRLPVLDDGKVVGMLTLCDLARSGNCEMEAADALTEISANIRRK